MQISSVSPIVPGTSAGTLIATTAGAEFAAALSLQDDPTPQPAKAADALVAAQPARPQGAASPDICAEGAAPLAESPPDDDAGSPLGLASFSEAEPPAAPPRRAALDADLPTPVPVDAGLFVPTAAIGPAALPTAAGQAAHAEHSAQVSPAQERFADDRDGQVMSRRSQRDTDAPDNPTIKSGPDGSPAPSLAGQIRDALGGAADPLPANLATDRPMPAPSQAARAAAASAVIRDESRSFAIGAGSGPQSALPAGWTRQHPVGWAAGQDPDGISADSAALTTTATAATEAAPPRSERASATAGGSPAASERPPEPLAGTPGAAVAPQDRRLPVDALMAAQQMPGTGGPGRADALTGEMLPVGRPAGHARSAQRAEAVAQDGGNVRSQTASPQVMQPPTQYPGVAAPAPAAGDRTDRGDESVGFAGSPTAADAPAAAVTGTHTAAAGQSVPVADDAPHAQARQTHAPHRQIADAIVRTRDGIVEVQLDPLELGRVTLLLGTDHRAGIGIIAERPETLDLIRRHSDQLLQDLRDSGMPDARLDFARQDSPGGNGRDRGQPEQPPAPASPDAAPPPAPRAGERPAARQASASPGQIDIRF